MTTEPPGGGWQPAAGGYPPQPPAGNQPPVPHPFPASYPPPPPGSVPPPPPGGYPAPLPDPPRSGQYFDSPLPEPPTGAQPVLQWGDPTPVPTPPPRPGPPPPRSRLAVIAAVVGGLLGGGGLGLILGIAALIRIRTTGKRGKGLAVLGIVLTLAWAAAAGVVYVAVFSKPPLRDDAGTVTRTADIDVNQLRVGDCIEKFTKSRNVGSVTVLPCTSAHDGEVFHTLNLTGKDFPGDQEVTEQATKPCVDTFKTAVKPDDQKNANVALLKPVEASWKSGERQVTCIAVQKSGTITRSIRP